MEHTSSLKAQTSADPNMLGESVVGASSSLPQIQHRDNVLASFRKAIGTEPGPVIEELKVKLEFYHQTIRSGFVTEACADEIVKVFQNDERYQRVEKKTHGYIPDVFYVEVTKEPCTGVATPSLSMDLEANIKMMMCSLQNCGTGSCLCVTKNYANQIMKLFEDANYKVSKMPSFGGAWRVSVHL